MVAEPTAPRLDYTALLGVIPSEITQVDKQAQKKEAQRLKVERERAQEQVGPFLCLQVCFEHGSGNRSCPSGSFFCVAKFVMGMGVATKEFHQSWPALNVLWQHAPQAA